MGEGDLVVVVDGLVQKELSDGISGLEVSSSSGSDPEDRFPCPGPTSSDSPTTPTAATSTTTTTITTTETSGKRTRPFQFGQRHLSAADDVFSHNAWDHVAPDALYQSYVESQYQRQRQHPVSKYDQARFNAQPARWWDLFYRQKSTTFFKDRRWLCQEFPILDSVTQQGAGEKVVLEVGAGAGNTAFPIVRANRNERLRVHAVDFSRTAVETIRASPEFDGRFMRTDVWDLAAGGTGAEDGTDPSCFPPGLAENSVDIVLMIFVFSALSPGQWHQAVLNIYRLLRPGGLVLFRDYGRGDLAQVRFKAGRWMQDNFYLRGDGTRVYFFDKEELVRIWGGGGGGEGDGGREGGIEGEENVKKEARIRTGQDPTTSTPRFHLLNLDVDRRLIVNRQKRIKMHRCWIQGRFQKPQDSGALRSSKTSMSLQNAP